MEDERMDQLNKTIRWDRLIYNHIALYNVNVTK